MTVASNPIPPPEAHPPRVPIARGGLSLQQKLPLLMATILVVVLATSLALTYRALRNAAETALSHRVASVSSQMAGILETGIRSRSAIFARVAHDSLVRDALRAPAGAALPVATTDSVRTLLQALRQPADSALPIELWAADGHRVAMVGPPLDVDLREELGRRAPTTAEPPSNDAVDYGAFFVSGRRVYYQVTVPVTDRGTRLGYLVQLRRLGGGVQTAQQIRSLLGGDIALYLHNTTGPVWTTLAGELSAAPPRAAVDGRVSRDRIGELFTATAGIANTPWALTLESPVASAGREARSIVLSLALVSLLLTLAGALAAWLLGRRVTRPIVQLTAAAEAISRGDYRSRVAERGEAEVVRLARSFNRMAGEVDTSHRQLAAQFDESRAMTTDLEIAYERLQEAMHEAEDARDAAEQANRAKSDFLAVMSHELRTPLNAIGGYVELMQLGLHGPVTDAQMHALSRIARSYKHLLGLINDVLNFVRLGAGKVEFAIAAVPIVEALTSVEAMIGPDLEKKQIGYRFEECDPSLAVHADRDKVQQILLNVLSNAVKFTPQHGRIVVTCTQRGDEVDVAIRDTGPGIAPDRTGAVFEPFVQVERALNRPHDGVGLGLAISRDLARAMGGDLVVESSPPNGSVFIVRLPAAHVASRTAAA